MKRGYKRLLIFEIILFITLLLNSFVSSILTNYKLALYLIVVLILFKIFFGFEKDRHYYTKDAIFEEIIFLLIYFILFYLLGIIVSFARVSNYYTLRGITLFILPLIITIVLKEYLRYMMLNKAEGSKLLTITTVILFIMLDLTTTLYYADFKSNYQIFLFIALNFLPAISLNISLSYVSYKVGYKPAIIYQLATNLYKYLLPIIPNPDEYVASVIFLIVPALFCYKMWKRFEKEKDKQIDRDYYKHKTVSLVLPLFIVIFLVYITSGYFHFYAIAIASGSMTPNIHKGDVVIIEKTDGKFENIQEGQVIAYKYDGIIIVHRLVKKMKSGEKYYFYSKGDANKDIDGYKITEDMMIGIVRVKVPFVGLPTVWLNEL